MEKPVKSADQPTSSLRPAIWVNSTYFAEGLPYMLVRIVSTVFFTDLGAKERYLSYLNFLGVPWNLKFLWAPLVDAYGSLRQWLCRIQVALGLASFIIALMCYSAIGDPEPAVLLPIACIFVVMAFISATNDIAIDAYYIFALPRREDQALWSGHRVMAYRLAMVFARSGLVALVAWIALSRGGDDKYFPWAVAFAVAGAVLVALGLFHGALLIPSKPKDRGTDLRVFFVETFKPAFESYFRQDRIWLALLFIVLYKLGDELLFSMVTPFFLRELQVTKDQYAWIGGIVGAIGSVVGALAGGWYIKKFGLRRSLWPLTLVMNLSIWAYILLAKAKPDPRTMDGIWTIAAVHGYEQVAAGVGSAVLLIYLLRTCLPDFKATHYAVGSAIMSLPGTILGGFAGDIVTSVGYVNLFIIAFFASIPSMLLIPFVPLREQQG